MDEYQDPYELYMEERRKQLKEEYWSLWVFMAQSGCAPEHQELDGIALPPDHLFWGPYFPPVCTSCDCYVVGARSERGVRRLGGDPDKKIPDWCKL